MSLALRMGKTLHELLSQISSWELSLWEAFAQTEPFDDQRASLERAINTCTIANAWRGKDQSAFKPADFMPFIQKEQPEVKTEGLTGKVAARVARHLFKSK